MSSEPKRWLDDGAHPVVGHMLRAARAEHPPSGSLQRTLAGVGLGAGIAGVVPSASAAASGSGIFVKWTLLGCAVTIGAGFGANAIQDHVAAGQPAIQARQTAASVTRDRKVVATPLALQPAPAASAISESKFSPVPSRVGPPAPRALAPHAEEPDDVDLLAEETRIIEQARAEHAAGNSALALTALDAYERRFSVRRYEPEALYLRMEALLALGQSRAARQVAARLAATYPNSPHTRRAEAVSGRTIP